MFLIVSVFQTISIAAMVLRF